VILRDFRRAGQDPPRLRNDQAQITDASLLVLFTADLKALEPSNPTLWAKCPPARWLICGWLDGPLPRRPGRAFSAMSAQRSIGLAMQTLMLAATGAGLSELPD